MLGMSPIPDLKSLRPAPHPPPLPNTHTNTHRKGGRNIIEVVNPSLFSKPLANTVSSPVSQLEFHF